MWEVSPSRLQVCIGLNLIILNIEDDLIKYFKDFGVVVDAIVMRDRATGRGRGFGFGKMQFGDRDDMVKATD